MMVAANDNRVKYANELSGVGLAGLRNDQAVDRFGVLTKAQWETHKEQFAPMPTDGTAQPADGQSVGKTVASMPVVNTSPGSSGLSDIASTIRGSRPSPTGTTPDASNNYYVDPLAGTAASRVGALYKAQYEDQKARFVPIEDALMQQTTYMNKNLAGQEIGKAEADTMAGYDNIAGSQAIQLGRYGMSLNADQQASSDRLNGLGKSGAVVDAANNIRLKLVERNQQIASGAAQSIAGMATK